MSEQRREKIKQNIKEISALFIERIAGPTSLITLTRVELSEDSKKATLLISVLPTEKEKSAYGFVKRNLGELREELKKKMPINPLPFLDVKIDLGEKNRQRVEELLNNDLI